MMTRLLICRCDALFSRHRHGHFSIDKKSVIKNTSGWGMPTSHCFWQNSALRLALCPSDKEPCSHFHLGDGSLDLLEGALLRRLVRTPTHQLRRMAKSVTGHMVEPHLNDEVWLQRAPIRRYVPSSRGLAVNPTWSSLPSASYSPSSNDPTCRLLLSYLKPPIHWPCFPG